MPAISLLVKMTRANHHLDFLARRNISLVTYRNVEMSIIYCIYLSVAFPL